MQKINFLLVAFLLSGCGTSKLPSSSPEFGSPLLNEPVEVKALDGLWRMSLSPLAASSGSSANKPCVVINTDFAYIKVFNSSALTWHYGGKGLTAPINENGIFSFSKKSGYAYFFPGTTDRMPKPIMVTISARITEEGIGKGTIVYRDRNDEYATCGGSLEFQKSKIN